jgi:hypothetical protein
VTEATLGFKIDSSQASSAAADLDRLTSAAARTQQAADKLETEAAALGGSLSRAADGASKAAPPMERMAKSLADQDEHVRAFRMEVERLTMKYQPLAQATRTYEAAITEIERAHKVGVINAQQMTQALDRERQAYEKLRTSAASAGAAVKAANSNGGRGGSYQTAGITAQFQDIAVSAAYGNPLQVGLQQGTQLGEILKTLRKEGDETSGVMEGLADAATSLFDPVALLSIGLTSAGVAAYQYFTSAGEEAEKANRLFEEQNDLIRSASDLWGDATPALKAYVDQLDRADKLTQGRQAGEILAGRELDGLSANLDSIQKQGVAAFRALQGDPQNATVIRDLREAWGDLRDRLDDGSASMSDLNRVQGELANAVSQYGVPAVLDFKDAFDKVTESIYRGVEAAQKARTEWIKAIAGGTNVQDIVSGSTFTDGGRTFRPSDFVPSNVPTPTRRPLDLDQDPGAPTILNSDGRLTNVPVPGQKPNFFEIDDQTDKVTDLEKAYRRAQEAKADFWLDISFQQRQVERSAMDQQVATTLNHYGFNEDLKSPEAEAIRRQLRGQQAKEIATEFGDAFSSELISGSHNIGKAFLKGLESTFLAGASDLWKKFFDSIGNMILGAFTGGKGGGAASSDLGGLATALLGGAANDNMGKAPVTPVTRMPLGNIGSYANAIKSIESGGNYGALGPLTRTGDRAYGAYQVMGANIPSWTKGATGSSLSPSEFLGSKGAQDAVFEKYFGASVSKYGNPQDAASVWFTGRPLAQGAGAADVLGTTGSGYVDKFNNALGSATENLGGFGSGLGKIGESLSTSFFPSAPAASGGGGGGGLFSWLGSLFGGFKPIGAQAGLAASGKISGLFADGTNYAPGGLSIVGERGPELVNLPQGSQVFNTNRSAQMMGAGNDNGSSSPRKLEVHVHGGSGDEHVRELARQGAQEALYQDKIDQARGGFGNTQKKFNSRVG